MNTWAPGGDKPVSLALAVDLNKNGVRDQGEPVIRAGHEPYEDCGPDKLCDADEPGYNAETNPDPNQDDYDYQLNPTGTEGNHRYDEGEPFSDFGLDGVPNTAGRHVAGDVGEGDGKYTESIGLANFYANDAHSIVSRRVNGRPRRTADGRRVQAHRHPRRRRRARPLQLRRGREPLHRAALRAARPRRAAAAVGCILQRLPQPPRRAVGQADLLQPVRHPLGRRRRHAERALRRPRRAAREQSTRRRRTARRHGGAAPLPARDGVLLRRPPLGGRRPAPHRGVARQPVDDLDQRARRRVRDRGPLREDLHRQAHGAHGPDRDLAAAGLRAEGERRAERALSGALRPARLRAGPARPRGRRDRS